jgi:ribonuclease-3
MDLEGFALRIGYRFNDPELLRRALTHRSFGAAHNERLEFLGDSVVNCAVALELYQKFPRLAEGELSRLRASLVNQQSLAGIAHRLDLGGQLRLGEGELKSGGARRPSILADAVEAVIGAVFLDGGFTDAHAVVTAIFATELGTIDPATAGKDPKTLLQEYLQARRIALPQYMVVATRGEAHEQQFQVECLIPELGVRSQGEGSSRRSAEQEAARHAYELATRG